MAFIEYECAACGQPSGEFDVMIAPCPYCGSPEKKPKGNVGFTMPCETNSPAYQRWFHSEKTQSKLRSGEFEIASKSDNINHL